MEKAKITLGKPLVFSGTTIIPLIRCFASCRIGKGGIYAFGTVEPAAVIIKDSATLKTFILAAGSSREVSIEELSAQLPEIQPELLNSLFSIK